MRNILIGLFIFGMLVCSGVADATQTYKLKSGQDGNGKSNNAVVVEVEEPVIVKEYTLAMVDQLIVECDAKKAELVAIRAAVLVEANKHRP